MVDSSSDLAPLGMGSTQRPEGGNASLKTQGYDADGALKEFETRLWITEIRTDLELTFAEAHLRRGVSYTPQRQQERFLTFKAQFKAHGSNYELLSKRIRAHWRVNLNTTNAAPMVFTYFGAGRRWLGFVEDVSHSASYDDVLLEREFRMRVINRDASADSAALTGSGPYVPSRNDVHEAWDGWYTSSGLATMAATALGITDPGSGGGGNDADTGDPIHGAGGHGPV